MMLPRVLLPLVFTLPPLFAAIEPAPGAPPALPDPLVFSDGHPVARPADWPARRIEIVELFREHVYGRAPVGRPEDLRFEATEPRDAFDGRALRREVRATFHGPGGEGGFPFTVFYPKDTTPRGCVVLIVNRSPRIISQAETSPSAFWPVADIVARGYATAAFHYGGAALDKPAEAFGSGVFRVFGPPPDARPDDAWGAVAAWAWAASRVVDYLETDPLLKNAPIAVAGHSRGGKTALWCGAQDERVALAISNDSGTTGAALARTTRGETVARINQVFPHWFARNYHRYGADPAALPVDQHQLIATLAPRLAYVASASLDANADPAAEFAAALAASPAYHLHGLPGLAPASFPAPGEARHEGRIGYHLRAGEHDLRPEDWRRFLDFADRHWPARP